MSEQVEPLRLVAEKGITALKRQRNSCYVKNLLIMLALLPTFDRVFLLIRSFISCG